MLLSRPRRFFNWLATRPKSHTRRTSLRLESLEDRAVPAILSPAWVEQGPTLDSLLSNIKGIANNAAIGAIEAVLPHPTNPDVIYAGTANGGVWMTSNATQSSPTWTPLTDNMPSLSIGALAFSPADPTFQTIYAGTGNYSSYFSLDAPTGSTGVYKSTNGGTTWTVLGQSTFPDLNIRSVAPTVLNGGSTIFASVSDGLSTSTRDLTPGGPTKATPLGLYRSDDGGTSWSHVSGTNGLPDGPVTQVIVDPSNPQRIYAGVVGSGVYVADYSTVTGSTLPTWTATGTLANVSETTRIRLTAAAYPQAGGGTQTILYTALLSTNKNDDTRAFGFYRSSNGGQDWTAMDVPDVNPDGQGELQFSLVADPSNPDLVYAAGDLRNIDTSAGWLGNHMRGNAAAPKGSQWTLISNSALNPTAPHPDSRNMAFDAAGNLIEVQDGGIYKLTNPSSSSTTTPMTWTSLNGNLRVTEFLAIAYDPVNHIIFGGAQDNGSPQQDGPGLLTYHDQTSGDGGVTQIDALSMPGSSIRYSSNDSFGDFAQAIYDTTNTLLPNDTTYPALTVTGGTQSLGSVATLPFLTPFVLNAVTPTQLLIGTGSGTSGVVYESLNQGSTVTPISTASGTTNVGEVLALAYGGSLNGQANPGVAWVGTFGDGNGNQLFLRTTVGGTLSPLSNYPGTSAISIVLNPDNWQQAFIMDYKGDVYMTINAGQSFEKITSNLPVLPATPETPFGSLALFAGTAQTGDEVLFAGTANKGIWVTDNPGKTATWTRFGTGLPNVGVNGLVYNATDNVLVAGTLGRGAWTVPNLSTQVGFAAPVVNGPAAATFTQGGNPVVLAPGLTIADADSTMLASAQVQLANPRDGAAEVLTATTTGTNISAQYNATTGILTLTGTDTLANYQLVLASVTYADTAASPTVSERAVTMRVNDGSSNSSPLSISLNVIPQNTSTQVDLNGSATGQDNNATFTENGTATPVAPQANLTDADSTNLAEARVTILGTVRPGEMLSADTSGTTLTATYDASKGQLLIHGTGTVADYQLVLRTVRYNNTANDITLGRRDISFVVNDGTLDSGIYLSHVTLMPVNDAPVLDASQPFVLPTIPTDNDENEGEEIATLLNRGGAGDAIMDIDRTGRKTIAIIAVDNTNGRWQYRLEDEEGHEDDSGDEEDRWEDFEEVSETNALLLPVKNDVRIRFLPNPRFHGTVTNGLQFRAWDATFALGKSQALEIGGNRIDASSHGGSTGFSDAVGSFAITVQSPYKSDNERFVARVYLDLLGRQVEAGGLAYWATGLDGKFLDRAAVVRGIEASSEYRNRVLDQLYSDLLHRTADAAGRAYWLAFLDHGKTVRDVEAGILGSAEYFSSRGGASVAGFLNAVYNDTLRRAVDNQGSTVWTAALNAGVSREVVAALIVNSAEHNQIVAQGSYERFLQRNADPAGLQYFVTVLNNTASEELVNALFLESAEYFGRA